jgi:hypothetical protein
MTTPEHQPPVARKVLKPFVFIDEGVRRAMTVGEEISVPARIVPGLENAGYIERDPAAKPVTKTK